MNNFSADNKFKLGFGLMRLPKNEDGTIDVLQVSQMVDLFLEAEEETWIIIQIRIK